MTRRTAVLAAVVVGLATAAVAAGTWVTGTATGSLRAVEHFYRAHKDAGYFRLPNAG